MKLSIEVESGGSCFDNSVGEIGRMCTKGRCECLSLTTGTILLFFRVIFSFTKSTWFPVLLLCSS